jgi:hypothetical protein
VVRARWLSRSPAGVCARSAAVRGAPRAPGRSSGPKEHGGDTKGVRRRRPIAG